MFQLAQQDFHNFMSLNTFASKEATSAVTVGHSSKDLQIIYWPYYWSVNIVIFRSSIFPS